MRLSRRKKKLIRRFEAFTDRHYPDYPVPFPHHRSKEHWWVEYEVHKFTQFRRTK